jgi:hypothetical protein
MKFSSDLLWASFKKAFVDTTNEIKIEDFAKAWSTSGDRTMFYFNSLLQTIAKKLDLTFERELIYRIDGVFSNVGSQNTKVPIIYLESENDITTSDREVYKLCTLNAPLKILMVCNQWNESSKKLIKEYYWDYIIEDFAEQIGLKGVFAVIIGEWNETLRIYTHVFNEKGEVIEDSLLLEK